MICYLKSTGRCYEPVMFSHIQEVIPLGRLGIKSLFFCSLFNLKRSNSIFVSVT
ncbi:hypothetical protein HWD31_gp50 [Pantoea phage vB_PagM_SSEM1]|uniref:Uncharacterized protein n=1 Tax=Pantoea phage vB_PagM_SSEM1 TaxID=2721760 RepID=A0A6H0D8I2_9CAUD|nr:hypothetical protein HWD31_gp50 [Pantoea phage vB_PagM_SSEM1]QIS79374.1 hypothetical protein SSEM1_gp50 [Pantoea phage vB_PagM_SSEM1]